MFLAPQVSRGRLSIELRRARIVSGLTQQGVAKKLGWSPSKMARIELGQLGMSKSDLVALLSLYDLTDPVRTAQLVNLAAGSRQRLPGGYRDLYNPARLLYLGYEQVATRIHQFTPYLLPDLLQTAQYAASLIRAVEPDTPPSLVRARLEAQRFRQEIFDRPDPPHAGFLIDETALRRWPVRRGGAPDIRQDQLRRLRELAARRTVQIQIVPLTHGTHFGMGTSYTILEFDEPGETDVLFVDRGQPSPLTRDRPDLAR